MSSLLFPYTLPGIQFDYLRYYVPSTGVQQAVSGKTSTIAYRPYPLVHFEYAWEFLQDYNSGIAPLGLQQLVGLINQVRGRYDTFLHTDPDFNAVTAQSFGTATVDLDTYQLVATYGNSGGPGTAELVQNLNGTPTLYANGTAISASTYSIGPTGIVTFTTLPTVGDVLTWTGSFYYRCRFDKDHYDFKKMMRGLWSVDKISFESVSL
jgi:uncharacterized protein (TIGR02217 family)